MFKHEKDKRIFVRSIWFIWNKSGICLEINPFYILSNEEKAKWVEAEKFVWAVRSTPLTTVSVIDEKVNLKLKLDELQLFDLELDDKVIEYKEKIENINSVSNHPDLERLKKVISTFEKLLSFK